MESPAPAPAKDAAAPSSSATPSGPPPKPDIDAFMADVKKRSDEVAALQEKRDRIQARIGGTKGANDELNARLQEARTRFQTAKCVPAGWGGAAHALPVLSPVRGIVPPPPRHATPHFTPPTPPIPTSLPNPIGPSTAS